MVSANTDKDIQRQIETEMEKETKNGYRENRQSYRNRDRIHIEETGEKRKERGRAVWAPWDSFVGISGAVAGVPGGAVSTVWGDRGKERQVSALLAASLPAEGVKRAVRKGLK